VFKEKKGVFLKEATSEVASLRRGVVVVVKKDDLYV